MADFPYGNYPLNEDNNEYRAVVEGEGNAVWIVKGWVGENVYLRTAGLRQGICVNGSFVRIVGDEEEL